MFEKKPAANALPVKTVAPLNKPSVNEVPENKNAPTSSMPTKPAAPISTTTAVPSPAPAKPQDSKPMNPFEKAMAEKKAASMNPFEKMLAEKKAKQEAERLER